MDEIKGVSTFWSNPITLIAAGAIIGFITSTAKDFINHCIQSKKAKNELALKRLDELFVSLFKNANTIRKTLPNILSNSTSADNFDDSNARLGFIIRVYFPSMLSDYQNYIQKAIEFSTYQTALALTIEKKDILTVQSNQDYKDKHLAFEKLYGDMCTLIVEKAKEYK